MTGRIGLKHLADRLGLDISTVSRALRNDPRVRPETIRAVTALATELDYRPNAIARALKGGQSGRVAVLLSPPQQRFASPIFLELLSTLDQHLRDTGRSLAVFAARTRDEELGIVRSIVEDGLADGIVLGRTQQTDARVDYLLKAGFPFVTFGRTGRDDEHPWIEIDYAAAGRIAAMALVAALPRVLHVISGPEGLRFADNYTEGVLNVARSAGIGTQIHRVEMTEAMGERIGLRILDRPDRMAIACIQDSLAFGVYRAAAERGVRLGCQAAIFGGQNFPGSEHAAPALSTFSTEDARVAGLLSEAILARLSTGAGYRARTVVMPTALLRASHLLGPA